MRDAGNANASPTLHLSEDAGGIEHARDVVASSEGDSPDSPSSFPAGRPAPRKLAYASRRLARMEEGPDGACRSRDFEDSPVQDSPVQGSPVQDSVGLFSRSTDFENLACDPSTVPEGSESPSSDEGEEGLVERLRALRERERREEIGAEVAIQHALQHSAYAACQQVGKGSYGCVWSGFLRADPARKVAIKHCNEPFRHKRDAVRTLREIRLLKLLKHPRIVELRSVVLPEYPETFSDLHLVFDLAACDLAKMVRSETNFDETHRRWIVYQILQGLEYMHSRGVIHRDIKPANVLIDENCDIRIADFGMARAVVEGDNMEDRIGWSVYVASRWYRPPELLKVAVRTSAGRWQRFKEAPYTTAIDVWGVGTIMAELRLRQPAFKGRTSPHQLQLIRDGVATQEAFDAKFEAFEPPARDLLRQMLYIDPWARHRPAAGAACLGRASATEALRHPYFERLHGLRSARVRPGCRGRPLTALDFDFEAASVGIPALRRMVLVEAKKDNPLGYSEE
jgi:serine/threonine protein kinase